jgi:hypothetical protein
MTYSCCYCIRVIMSIMYDIRFAEIASIEGSRKVSASSNNKSPAIWGIFEEGLARGLCISMISLVICWGGGN